MKAVTLLRWLLSRRTHVLQLCTGAVCAIGVRFGQLWVLHCDPPTRAHGSVVVWRGNVRAYQSYHVPRVRVVHCLARAAYGVLHALAPTDQQLAREWLASGCVDLRAWLSYQRLAAHYFQCKVPSQTPLPSSRCP